MPDVKKPFISVVIPTYNSESYIVETLATVFAQTYEYFEVVVSDDGSSDRTCEAVKAVFEQHADRQTNLLKNAHAGPGETRNKGIEAARGKWIAFLDADDRWLPEKLKKVEEYIVSHEDIALVCHGEIWKTQNGEKDVNYRAMYDESVHPFLSLYRLNALSTSAVTVRKDMLMLAGLFDPGLPAAQDYDLWLRLALVDGMKMGFMDEHLGYYMIRGGSISANAQRRLVCLMEISRKYEKHLKKLSPFPFKDRRVFEGQAHTTAGLVLLRRGEVAKGLSFFLTGMLKWPFRFDWLKKLV